MSQYQGRWANAGLQCWSRIAEGRPIFSQHWPNVCCLWVYQYHELDDSVWIVCGRQIYCTYDLSKQERFAHRLRCWPNINLYNTELILYKPWRSKGLFQFEIIINVLVSSFRFIWIPMLWVSAGNVCKRQNLTSTDVRFWRIKTLPALKWVIQRVVWILWLSGSILWLGSFVAVVWSGMTLIWQESVSDRLDYRHRPPPDDSVIALITTSPPVNLLHSQD